MLAKQDCCAFTVASAPPDGPPIQSSKGPSVYPRSAQNDASVGLTCFVESSIQENGGH